MIAKDCPDIKDTKFYKKILGYDYSNIIKIYSTPTAIYFQERIIQNITSMKTQFKQFQKKEFFYAMKANSQPQILKEMKNQGLGVEVMSEFELKLALKVGFLPSKIIFNGPAKTDSALKMAINKKIKLIIVDSLSEVQKLVNLNKKIPVLVRCHPVMPTKINKKLFVNNHSKLGLATNEKEILLVLNLIQNSKLILKGFSFNLAARQRTFDLHSKAIDYLIQFYSKLDDSTKLKLKIIDIGGGFDSPLFIDKKFKFKKQQLDFFRKNNITLFVEPGRSIINDTGIFLTKVITKKKTKKTNYLFVDVATNYLIPLPLSYYIVKSQKKGKKLDYSVADGICSTAGVINTKVKLPQTKENDILLILNCGGYTFNMFEHFYDTRPTILMIKNTKLVQLNKRESFNTAYNFIKN